MHITVADLEANQKQNLSSQVNPKDIEMIQHAVTLTAFIVEIIKPTVVNAMTRQKRKI